MSWCAPLQTLDSRSQPAAAAQRRPRAESAQPARPRALRRAHSALPLPPQHSAPAQRGAARGPPARLAPWRAQRQPPRRQRRSQPPQRQPPACADTHRTSATHHTNPKQWRLQTASCWRAHRTWLSVAACSPRAHSRVATEACAATSAAWLVPNFAVALASAASHASRSPLSAAASSFSLPCRSSSAASASLHCRSS